MYNDPWYMGELDKASANAKGRGEDTPTGHRISESSSEVQAIREVRRELQGILSAITSMAGGKPKTPPPDTYRVYRKPQSTRRERHEALVARLLPNKRKPAGESPPAQDQT